MQLQRWIGNNRLVLVLHQVAHLSRWIRLYLDDLGPLDFGVRNSTYSDGVLRS